MMLTSYLDTSGHQDGDAPLVVAGLASTERHWLHFEREWRSMLQTFGVPYLHMKEYAHFRGPFEKWRNDPASRKHFLARATDIIAKHVKHVATHYIALEEFRAVDRDYRLGEFFEGAYALAAGGCVLMLKKWKNEKHPNEPMKYVVEAGDAGQGAFVQLVKHYNIPVVPQDAMDESGAWFAPFQAADFIAYEVAKQWTKQGAWQEVVTAPRKSLVGILERVRPVVYFLPRESIRELVEEYPNIFPRRSSAPSASPSSASSESPTSGPQ
jgi:hypothetical protein